MFQHMNEREKKIVELLSEDSGISIQKIGELLGVSHVTVRSDLSSLEGKGIIHKLRGGALPAFHPEILERQKENIAEKQKIARRAAELVEDGDTIMINDGTTSSMIARFLLGKRDIRLVTNSTLLLPFVRVNPSLHTTLIGGDFKVSSEAVVGSQALTQLENYHVKYVFIGTGGFSIETGMTTHLQEGAEIVRKMTGLGDKIVLVAHSAKYNRNGFVRILPLEEADIIITDSGLDASVCRKIEALGIELIIV